jgi:PilZ domain
MNTPPVRFERRPMQRFALNLPLSVRSSTSGAVSSGFTQDLSARGVFFYTDLPLAKDDPLELTFVMPSEITLAETMRVRCRGKVVRVVAPERGATYGVAVRLEGYDFLSENDPLVSGTGAISHVPAAVRSASEQESPRTGCNIPSPSLT